MNFWLLTLLLVLGGFVILTFYLDPKKRGKNLPPVVSGPIPILGAFPTFSVNPVKAVREAFNKNGDIFTLHTMGFNMTFLIGPEAHQVFFKATDEELSPREAYQMVVPVFGPGVVYDCPTSVMYEQLKFVKSGLVLGQLRKSVPIITAEAKAYFEQWGQSGELDMLEHMNRLTMLTASRCLLGPEIRGDPKVSAEFAALYHDLEGGLNPISFFFPYLPIPSHIKRDKARVEVSKLFSRVIKGRRQLPADQKPDDMLQILMDSQYKNGEVLTDDQIAGMLIGVLFAGQHTSGITATWTAFFLAQKPELFKEIQDEQKQIIEEFGEEITFDSLKKCVKLENCVREALRMFPPLIMLMRKVKQELTYKNYTIPVGDMLCVSPAVAHRVSECFTNADSYDPERFAREEHTKQPYSYLSFGGGRHGCPGENFGIIQIKTLWTILLRNFNFEMAAKELPPADYTNLVVGPKQPATLRYTRKTTTMV
jgi:sterol 14-demethylase